LVAADSFDVNITYDHHFDHSLFYFFLSHTPTTAIYTLSLHDALPIFPRQIRANTISFTVSPEIVPSIGNSFINTMKNINHTRSRISDDIRNILCSSANMRRAIPLILRLLMNYVNLSTNLASHFFDLVIGKILTSRLSLSKHLAHNLGNLLLLGKIGVFHNRRNASSRLLLLISKHLILCIYL